MSENGSKRPPEFAEKIIALFAHYSNSLYILGDLEEDFQNRYSQRGLFFTNLWYWFQCLIILPGIIKYKIMWSLIIFRNYFKSACRNIFRNKLFSAINISSLTFGMALSLLLILYIQNELSYDRFHVNSANIYRINTETRQRGGQTGVTVFSPIPLGAIMKNEISEIKNTVRFIEMGKSVFKYEDKSFIESGLCLVDPSIFDVFTFSFMFGNAESALSTPSSVVITEKTAQRYFENEDPIGKTLIVDNHDALVVSGVIDNVPVNSTIQFDILIPFESVLTSSSLDWESVVASTYILLDEKASFTDVNTFISEWKSTLPVKNQSFYLQPLEELRLKGLNGSGTEIGILIFSFLAVIVLVLGCFNFMNLSVAQSSSRFLDVGLRKVIGASRGDIIRQYLGESILLSFFALFFAIIFAWITLPYFNNVTAKDLTFISNKSHYFIILSFLVALISGVVAGSYPAFIISNFKPVDAIKGTIKFGAKKQTFRKIIIVMQFMFSVVFIILALVLDKQVNYLTNKDMGFNKENMIIVPIEGIRKHFDSFKNELLENPQILNITIAGTYPKGGSWGTYIKTTNSETGSEEEQLISYNSVDSDYLETFKIDIMQGRGFSSLYSSDTTSFIVNEAAVKFLNLESPIGHELTMFKRTGTIIGVMKDYHHQNLTIKIKPLILRLMPPECRNIFIRLSEANSGSPELVSYIKNTWESIAPEHPFEYEYLDYVMGIEDREVGRNIGLIKYITLFIIFISCLGLFALSLYLTELRKKEVAVRKVLGATEMEIIKKMSGDYLTSVFIAIIIAVTVCWFIVSELTKIMPYRADVSALVYIVPCIIVLTIAFVTVSFNVIKAATTNPVNSLRCE